MARSSYTFFMALLILSANVQVTSTLWQELGGAVLGVTAVAVGGPLALGAIGFTAGGITAGSTAAGLMSAAATTGYGAGAVAALQSAGAAGVGLGAMASGAGIGAAVGAASKGGASKGCEEERSQRCH